MILHWVDCSDPNKLQQTAAPILFLSGHPFPLSIDLLSSVDDQLEDLVFVTMKRDEIRDNAVSASLYSFTISELLLRFNLRAESVHALDDLKADVRHPGSPLPRKRGFCPGQTFPNGSQRRSLVLFKRM